MQSLMHHAEMTEEQKLERIYRNSHPDYRWYIRRKDFTSLTELHQLADDLESIQNSARDAPSSPQKSFSRSVDHPKTMFYRTESCDEAQKQNKNLCEQSAKNNGTSITCEEHRLVATVLIEARQIKPTIDTGATHCFIKKEYAERLKKNLTYMRQKQMLR
ncbi:uncharacterized protein [Musca autumnalis]|uniref:uncharacterized protein n=1 Tax=Musca autumnalis TaxID=221902 RepID=UPI003CE9550E